DGEHSREEPGKVRARARSAGLGRDVSPILQPQVDELADGVFWSGFLHVSSFVRGAALVRRRAANQEIPFQIRSPPLWFSRWRRRGADLSFHYPSRCFPLMREGNEVFVMIGRVAGESQRGRMSV